MSKVFIEESTLTAIGDAIRSKYNTSNLYNPTNMPAAIRAIQTGGEIQSATVTTGYNSTLGLYNRIWVGSYIGRAEDNWIVFFSACRTKTGTWERYAYAPFLNPNSVLKLTTSSVNSNGIELLYDITTGGGTSTYPSSNEVFSPLDQPRVDRVDDDTLGRYISLYDMTTGDGWYVGASAVLLYVG